jgi:hypothetical protein
VVAAVSLNELAQTRATSAGRCASAARCERERQIRHDANVHGPAFIAATSVSDRVDEDAREGRKHVGAEGGRAPKLEGEREHPLAHGHRGQHAIDDARRDVAHAAAGAARARAAALARERNEQIVSARVDSTACTKPCAKTPQ